MKKYSPHIILNDPIVLLLTRASMVEVMRATDNAKKGYVVDERGNPLIRDTIKNCYKALEHRVGTQPPERTDCLDILTNGYCQGVPPFWNEPWMKHVRKMLYYRKLWLYPILSAQHDIVSDAEQYWNSQISAVESRRSLGTMTSNALMVANLIDRAPDSPLRTKIIDSYMKALVAVAMNGLWLRGGIADIMMNYSVKWTHPLLVSKIKPMIVKCVLSS